MVLWFQCLDRSGDMGSLLLSQKPSKFYIRIKVSLSLLHIVKDYPNWLLCLQVRRVHFEEIETKVYDEDDKIEVLEV